MNVFDKPDEQCQARLNNVMARKGRMKSKKGFSIVQYACAVLLIVTSILMVSYQVITISDVANGLLMYVAQAFLLAGSIFGLDYYVKQLRCLNENQNENENSKSAKPPSE